MSLPAGTAVNPSVVVGVRQLFLDDDMVEQVSGLTRHWHAATKHPANPIVDPSGLERRCQVYGTILYLPEEQRYQLWYLTIPKPPVSDTPGYLIGGRLRPGHATLV